MTSIASQYPAKKHLFSTFADSTPVEISIRGRVDSDGDVAAFITFSADGYEWKAVDRLWLCNHNDEEIIGFFFRSDRLSYLDCITLADRKRPNASYQHKIIDAVSNALHSDEDATMAAIRSFEKELKFSAGHTDEGRRTAELEAELASLKAQREAEAAKTDINALIMNSVVESLTPRIVEKIRDRVGNLVDAVPTRLEVKIAEAVHQTGESVRHVKFEQVLNVMCAGFPVWLVGEAGTGKSKLCEQIAEAMGAEYRYSGAILDEFAGLKGFIDANGVKHGTNFTEALDLAKSGQDVVFCMDECDGSTPEVLLVLNNLLAGGQVECMGESYQMNDHLHIVACGNTNGRGGSNAYTRSIIDSATLDRFVMIEIDYDKSIELVSAGGDKELSAFARQMRKSAQKCGIDLLVTYRGITRTAVLSKQLGDKREALKMSLIRGLDKADLGTLCENMRRNLSGNTWLETLEEVRMAA